MLQSKEGRRDCKKLIVKDATKTLRHEDAQCCQTNEVLTKRPTQKTQINKNYCTYYMRNKLLCSALFSMHCSSKYSWLSAFVAVQIP